MRTASCACVFSLCLVWAADGQVARFRAGVAAVRVDALVTDGRRPVANLTAANFELRDNGVPQKVTDVSYESLPLNVICALDVSSSVSGKPLEQLRAALAELFDALGPRDRAALLTFSHQVVLHTPLTSDRDRLRKIAAGVTAGGATSFFDAGFSALTLRETDDNRALLLLFSDGIDTASWLSASELLDAARRSDVVIYPVTKPAAQVPMIQGFHTPFGSSRTNRAPSTDPDGRIVEKLAEETGGRVFVVAPETSLSKTFLDVLAEFRQRYVISYEPTGVAADGWHAVEVKVKGKSGQVRARRGYFAANPTPAPEPRKPH